MAAQIVACPQCGRMLVIPEAWQGMVMRCPTCGNRFVTGADAEPRPVPEPVSAPQEEPPEPPPAPPAHESRPEADTADSPAPERLVPHDGLFLPALQPLEPDAGSEEERPRRHHLETSHIPSPRPAHAEPPCELRPQRFFEPEDLAVPEPNPDPEPRPKVKEPPPPRPRHLPPLEGPSQTGKVVLLLLGIFGFLLVFGGLVALIVQLSQRGHSSP